jgi:hypothetical protein
LLAEDFRRLLAAPAGIIVRFNKLVNLTHQVADSGRTHLPQERIGHTLYSREDDIIRKQNRYPARVFSGQFWGLMDKWSEGINANTSQIQLYNVHFNPLPLK